MTKPITPARHPSHKRPTRLKTFYFGAPYYPEHWDEATRSLDPERMAAAGFNMVRLAEFAWDRMEPKEGTFDFALFDATIARLSPHGIRTMLCTPTATPPAWLTTRHPEILRVNADGISMVHGTRRHSCHSNATYRRYSRAITQAMADHYRNNPDVVAWQTDNELNCHMSECHCESCTRAFQEFLRRKFGGDIARLNAAWGTAFWAQTYGKFEAIPTPKPNKPACVNPAHQLDYFRFISWLVTDFQHEQVAILRAASPDWLITHNGLFPHIDYRGQFTTDLDVLGFDSYAMFTSDAAARPRLHAAQLDRARAWSGNFIVPEHQSGPGGATTYFHDNPEPGEIRRLTYTAIARGGDSLLYFRWRACRFGAEEYWCGILDHDNVPRRRYDEIAKTGAELKRIGPAVLGTHVFCDAAVAHGDMEVFDAEIPLHFGLPSPPNMAEVAHGVLYEHGLAVGCVHPGDDLSDLKLYVVPHWPVFNPAWVPNLARFVERGGVLVIGARTATRNLDNNVVPETIPGCLRELAGATVAEYGRQNGNNSRPLSLMLNAQAVPTEHWYETLLPDAGTTVLARWTSRHLSEQPAVTCHRVGKGAVIYVGTFMTTPLFRALLPTLIDLAKIKPLLPDIPPGIEVTLRTDGTRKLWFIVNTNEHPITILDPPPGQDLTINQANAKPLTLAAWDVSVIEPGMISGYGLCGRMSAKGA